MQRLKKKLIKKLIYEAIEANTGKVSRINKKSIDRIIQEEVQAHYEAT